MTESEQKWIETNNQACGLLRLAHDLLACSSLPPRRTWVGLTVEESVEIQKISTCYEQVVELTEAKLKEKNNG